MCNQCNNNSQTKQNLKDHTQKEHDNEGDSGGFSAINNMSPVNNKLLTKQNLKDHTQKEHDNEGDSGGFSAINNRVGTRKQTPQSDS